MQLRQAADANELTELMARYTRAVNSLAWDRLPEALRDDVVIRYSWRLPGAADYSSVELTGLPAAEAWLDAQLGQRPSLRRYVSGFRLLEWSADEAAGSVQMHERDMRITGIYRLHAVRGPLGWRISRLDLKEEIHFSGGP